MKAFERIGDAKKGLDQKMEEVLQLSKSKMMEFFADVNAKHAT